MDNVEALARDWLNAKSAETKANRARLAIETQIGEALDHRDEGSITHTLDNFKVTLTQPVYRKVDVEVWDQVKSKCPAKLHPVKIKTEADATGVKWLIEHEPDLWTILAPAFETKPGKLGVKVVAL